MLFPVLAVPKNPVKGTALPKGGGGGGVRASAEALESWPLSHRLLISSVFQAAGGSSGRPFQGAVPPPVLGRGEGCSRKLLAVPGWARCY